MERLGCDGEQECHCLGQDRVRVGQEEGIEQGDSPEMLGMQWQAGIQQRWQPVSLQLAKTNSGHQLCCICSNQQPKSNSVKMIF